MKRPRLNTSLPLMPGLVVLLVGAVGYLAFSVHSLTQQMATSADQALLDAVSRRVDQIDGRLDKVDERPFVPLDDFRSAQSTMVNRLDVIAKQADEATATTRRLTAMAATNGDLLQIRASVETLQAGVEALRKAAEPKPKATPTPPKKAVNKPPVKPKPKPPEEPPFQISGVEYRGGERFLSVAPVGSTRLSQIYLIRPGDAIAGTSWKLRQLDDSSAQFETGSGSRTISLQP